MFYYSSLYILNIDLITKYTYKKLIGLTLINNIKLERPKIQLNKKKNENYFNFILLFFLRLIINNRIIIKNNNKFKTKIKIISSYSLNNFIIYNNFLLNLGIKVNFKLNKKEKSNKINNLIFFYPLILNNYKWLELSKKYNFWINYIINKKTIIKSKSVDTFEVQLKNFQIY